MVGLSAVSPLQYLTLKADFCMGLVEFQVATLFVSGEKSVPGTPLFHEPVQSCSQSSTISSAKHKSIENCSLVQFFRVALLAYMTF